MGRNAFITVTCLLVLGTVFAELHISQYNPLIAGFNIGVLLIFYLLAPNFWSSTFRVYLAFAIQLALMSSHILRHPEEWNFYEFLRLLLVGGTMKYLLITIGYVIYLKVRARKKES